MYVYMYSERERDTYRYMPRRAPAFVMVAAEANGRVNPRSPGRYTYVSRQPDKYVYVYISICISIYLSLHVYIATQIFVMVASKAKGRLASSYVYRVSPMYSYIYIYICIYICIYIYIYI